jgi:hypothetical protein
MIAWDSQKKPKVRLQLHWLDIPGGPELFFWQVRSMEGQVLVESPMYRTAEEADEVIRSIEFEFDPLKVKWADGTGVRP